MGQLEILVSQAKSQLHSLQPAAFGQIREEHFPISQPYDSHLGTISVPDLLDLSFDFCNGYGSNSCETYVLNMTLDN